MNIFTIFFYKILGKYSPKRSKSHHFFKFSRGSMPLRAMQIPPLFQKYFEPPPPPRNPRYATD